MILQFGMRDGGAGAGSSETNFGLPDSLTTLKVNVTVLYGAIACCARRMLLT
jgi:hypothetical protein